LALGRAQSYHILFIIYVNDLITNLEKTDTGVRGNSMNPELKVACIMFVDDIETYTHTIKDLKTQFDTVIEFARTHRAILNTAKSTITSSQGKQALEKELKKIKIQLEAKETTKQLGTRLSAKQIRDPDNTLLSTDVGTRCGVTESMINTMMRKGLRAGDMNLADMTKIIASIIIPTLTFGLASTDINRKDKNKIRTTIATATQGITGITPSHDPKNTWATLELGLTDPIDTIAITDWTTVISMITGEANELASEIVQTDSCLKTALEEVSGKWGFEARTLAHIGKKNRSAWLKTKARTHRIKQTNNTYFDPTGKPVWQNSALSQHHITLLIKYRCMRAQGRLEKNIHCVLCLQKNIQHKGIQHSLNHCTHGAEIAKNSERTKYLTPQEKQTWQNLDAQSISELCAKPTNRENLLSLALDTLNHCHIFEPKIIIVPN
jgi:hypothetical protein